MHKETPPGEVTYFESRSRKLAYLEEFRQMLEENPGITRAAITLADQAVAEYDPSPVQMVNEEGYIREVKYDRETGKWLRQVDDESWSLQEGEVRPEGVPPGTKFGDWIPMDFGRCMLFRPGKPIIDEATGLVVSVIGRSNREFDLEIAATRIDKSDYFIMTINGKSFFVKRSFITLTPGASEFKNTLVAKGALKDLPFVRVVEAQLGYQSKNESWYVSKWEDIENAGYEPYELVKTKELEEKVTQIKDRLIKIGIGADISSNLFYNPGTNNFILLDITGQDKLGTPLVFKKP